MQVLHLSAADLEGGAGRAALRLSNGFRGTGIDSQMLVRAKSSGSNSVLSDTSLLTKLGPSLDRLYLKCFFNQVESKFSPQWFPDTIASQIGKINPDIVHLHWICNGYIRIESLRNVRKPIVWTLHDMWPFTGGCHYSEGCGHYKDKCGQCPQLHSKQSHDLSAKVMARKANAWKKLNLTIVTPSVWLAECARDSFLFKDRRVEVIPNGIDTTIFRPMEKALARQILNLPQQSKLILFGAGNLGDKRKGFDLLIEALAKLPPKSDETLELAILGAEKPDELPPWSYKTHYLGKLNDELSLAIVYCAADVFVAPSREDNLPNTVLEALACGKPCVAFKVGGMADLIDHEINGYLAAPFQAADLAKGISLTLNNLSSSNRLFCHARAKVEKEFTVELQVKRFSKLYSELLAQE